jgi:hypothetical protein
MLLKAVIRQIFSGSDLTGRRSIFRSFARYYDVDGMTVS